MGFCTHCNGLGQLSRTEILLCSSCDGQGQQRRYEKCRECAGFGWGDNERHEATKCWADGCVDGGIYTFATCRSCDGQGTVRKNVVVVCAQCSE
jgi:DnaJ-class molecular chaperone